MSAVEEIQTPLVQPLDVKCQQETAGRHILCYKVELVVGVSNVTAKDQAFGDKSELVASTISLSEVLRIMDQEKAELVTGKQ
jgi:hypothetical protein